MARPRPTKKNTDGGPSLYEYNPLVSLTPGRKGFILFFLCLAQFLDTFMNSALFAAIPPVSVDLNISNADSVWLISGYQLTFAALLLVSGRLSDFLSEIVFSVGATLIGGLSLGAGFVRAQVPLIVLRVLTGIGAALTVPSALHLIIHMFPDPASQGKAIAGFGASAAFGNVIGLVIGALIVTYASWPWVFYLFSILGFFLAIAVFVLAPSPHRPRIVTRASRFQRLDLIGVSLLTIGLVLFIFGVTSGSVNGWNSARCLAPFFISLLLIVGPPSLWAFTNVAILVASALLPFMWWATVQLLFSWLWQEVYGWSPIIVALHLCVFNYFLAAMSDEFIPSLPLGLLGFPMNALASVLHQIFPLKWVITAGQVLALIATILLPFADTEARYWRFAFPAFCIGTSGITIAFTTVNIAIFASTPPASAGVVGALFNCALQLGCAAGTAIITSLQTSVQQTHGGPTGYDGRKAGFWFLFALLALLTAAQVVFMKNTVPPLKQKKMDEDKVIEIKELVESEP
ncbi:MFS general substrate transporter [Mycena filopes]|nr:MFS general substrate transporter [Mycena filopes]